MAAAKQAQNSARSVFQQARAFAEKGDAANAKRMYQSAHHTLGEHTQALENAGGVTIFNSIALIHPARTGAGQGTHTITCNVPHARAILVRQVRIQRTHGESWVLFAQRRR